MSITIPSYRPRFFEAALQSALRQTYPNTEIVICDDCPDDGIARILDKYSASHPRLRYFRNSERLNRQNLVKCADVAQGEFIKFLNDDDLLAPNCIERMIECFKTLPDITLVTSKRTRTTSRVASCRRYSKHSRLSVKTLLSRASTGRSAALLVPKLRWRANDSDVPESRRSSS